MMKKAGAEFVPHITRLGLVRDISQLAQEEEKRLEEEAEKGNAPEAEKPKLDIKVKAFF